MGVEVAAQVAVPMLSWPATTAALMSPSLAGTPNGKSDAHRCLDEPALHVDVDESGLTVVLAAARHVDPEGAPRQRPRTVDALLDALREAALTPRTPKPPPRTPPPRESGPAKSSHSG